MAHGADSQDDPPRAPGAGHLAVVGSSSAIDFENCRNFRLPRPSRPAILFNRRRARAQTQKRVVAQLGSALDWGSRGRWFESSPPDHETAGQRLKPLTFFLIRTIFVPRRTVLSRFVSRLACDLREHVERRHGLVVGRAYGAQVSHDAVGGLVVEGDGARSYARHAVRRASLRAKGRSYDTTSVAAASAPSGSSILVTVGVWNGLLAVLRGARCNLNPRNSRRQPVDRYLPEACKPSARMDCACTACGIRGEPL